MATFTDEQYNDVLLPMMKKMKALREAAGFTAEDIQKENDWRTANAEEAKEEFMTTWKTADTDEDGSINRTEYNALCDMMASNSKARWGKAVELTDADKDEMYALMNKLNPDTEGFTMAELAMFGPAREKAKAAGDI